MLSCCCKEVLLRQPTQRPERKRKSLIQMSGDQRARAAAVAIYAGSPAHKLIHSLNDSTPCPKDLEHSQTRLTEWVRAAIAAGAAGGMMEGDFPRYVWYRDGERAFEGRLTNRALGEYKGYPIDNDELPAEMRPSERDA